MNLARTVSASLVLCTGLVLGAVALAGDLAPPAGPIAPTGKPLTEVEPRIALTQENTPGDANSVFRITHPGSYYLTSGFIVPSHFIGIEVAASDVTIDLKGFTIEAGQYTAWLISADGQSVARTTIQSGTLRGGRVGILLDFSSDSRIEGVAAVGNDGPGIWVGERSLVSDCSVIAGVTLTNAPSLQAGQDSIVQRCRVVGNGPTGISVGGGCRVRECVALGNGAGAPPGAGIRAGNSGLGNGGVIEGCFVAGNQIGILVGSPASGGWTVVRNVAKSNVVANYDVGAGNHAGAIVSDPALAGPWDNLSN